VVHSIEVVDAIGAWCEHVVSLSGAKTTAGGEVYLRERNRHIKI